MCTLTVLRESNRLLVTMNRDDIAAREEAPPAQSSTAEATFVAPRDLQAGGTWIGVNSHGVIACLLNRYDAAPAGRASRGNIVLEAMRSTSIDAACKALTALDHLAYSPFTSLLIARQSTARLDWTGSRLERTDLAADNDVLMVTSSSWQFDAVKAKREALFREIWADSDDAIDKVGAFHSRRVNENDAWAPMMQRPHSQTKSVTQVELTSFGAEMHYWTRDTAIDCQLTSPETSIRLNREKR
ncbi:MAG: NRDE family protein [Phycisphaerales bacterium]|nr:NRDE family protein [Hyphomonadaceae bacterium]